MKRIYEVLKSYDCVAAFHVLATSEDEAIKRCTENHFRKSYDDGTYHDVATIDQIWSIEDYEKQFGKYSPQEEL